MCFDECYSAFRDPTTFHPFCAWIVCNPGIPRIRVVDAVFAQLHSSKILPAPTSTHLRAQMAWKIMHKLVRDDYLAKVDNILVPAPRTRQAFGQTDLPKQDDEKARVNLEMLTSQFPGVFPWLASLSARSPQESDPKPLLQPSTELLKLVKECGLAQKAIEHLENPKNMLDEIRGGEDPDLWKTSTALTEALESSNRIKVGKCEPATWRRDGNLLVALVHGEGRPDREILEEVGLCPARGGQPCAWRVGWLGWRGVWAGLRSLVSMTWPPSLNCSSYSENRRPHRSACAAGGGG